MNKEFLIVHKSILPDLYDKVIEAREQIEGGVNVSDVCKAMGISRSSFYKFKDKVFAVGETYGKKAIVSLKTENQKGILSNIINTIFVNNGNVLTINQEMPIGRFAYITITLDTKDMSMDISHLISALKKVPMVVNAELTAIE